MLQVSVIIPSFNAKIWVKQAIQSAIEQNIKDIEIILVDDGSTDGTSNMIKREFPYVKLIRTGNQGPSKARNLGTKISTGEFIQYLDADDLLAPGKIKLQLEMLKNSDADIAYGNWQKLSKTKDGRFTKTDVIIKEMRNPEIDLFTGFWQPPAVYLFRRSMIEKVGGWNERLPIIQDARFVLDCALHGGRFTYCPEIMAYYRIHSSDSVSTRNGVSFVRDCFRNACEVEEWWKGTGGGLSKERKKALLKVYGYVARASFEKDRGTFENAYQALKRIDPIYIPDNPKHLQLISRLIGYRKAEIIALRYRQIKKVCGKIAM